VLDKVFIASAFFICGADELIHDVPLVIAWEDQTLFFDSLTVPVLFFVDLQVNKGGKDFQQIFGE